MAHNCRNIYHTYLNCQKCMQFQRFHKFITLRKDKKKNTISISKLFHSYLKLYKMFLINQKLLLLSYY